MFQDFSTGKFHTSPSFTGANGQVNLTALFDWMDRNGVGFNQVITLYHNHDRDHYTSNSLEVAVNRYPSGTVAAGGADWSVADIFVSRGADPNLFSLTIEDTSGVAREFNYSEKEYYKNLSLTEMDNGDGLPPARTGCGAV